MARVIKIDNSLQKRFEYNKKKQNSREIVAYFLIVCEGEKTEPNYFKSFPKKIGKVVYDIQFDGGGINTLKVVEKAIELRDNSKQKYDRVWAVFDRDSFPANSFNSAILKAKANGIECAWSNQAFELWYLLHFHNRITPMHRDEYKKAIESAINEKTNNKKDIFKYKKNDLNMFTTLNKYGNQEQAIKWAKDLNEKFDGQKFANFNPSTQVFKLVEELMGKSKKLNENILQKFQNGD
jgi:RloB-like protein